MAHYLAKTPKRHYIISNASSVRVLDKGRLALGKYRAKVKTARQYRDSQGRVRYQGTRHLKATELLFSYGGSLLLNFFVAPMKVYRVPEFSVFQYIYTV